MWEESIRANESLIFFIRMFRGRDVLRAMRPTSSDAKLMGGDLMWPCRPLQFASSKAFCNM